MELKLRPVTEADIKKILEWRNNPGVRANSFQTSEIKWEEHSSYWTMRLADKTNYSYIAVLEGTDAGLVRLDKKESGEYEINILIAPGFRGKGLGIATIAETKKIAAGFGITRLIARVKPDNVPSQKIFEKNGFERKGGNEEYVLYEFSL